MKTASSHMKGCYLLGKSPNRFLRVTLCLEYLSSGENLAGCALLVTSPSAVTFYERLLAFEHWFAYLESINSFPIL
jgi:hypothetical protein